MPTRDHYPLRTVKQQPATTTPGIEPVLQYADLELMTSEPGYLRRTCHGDAGQSQLLRKQYAKQTGQGTQTGLKLRGYSVLDAQAMGWTAEESHTDDRQPRRGSPVAYENAVPEGFDPINAVIKIIADAQKGTVGYSGMQRTRKMSISTQDGKPVMQVDLTIPYIKKLVAENLITRAQAIRMLILCENFKEQQIPDLATIKRVLITDGQKTQIGRIGTGDTSTFTALLDQNTELLDFHIKYGSSLIELTDALERYNPEDNFGKNIKAFLKIYDAISKGTHTDLSLEDIQRAAAYAILKGDREHLRTVLSTSQGFYEQLETSDLFVFLDDQEIEEIGIKDRGFQPLTPLLLATMCGGEENIVTQCCFPPTSDKQSAARAVNIAVANYEFTIAYTIITNFQLGRTDLDMELIETLTPADFKEQREQQKALALLQARTAEIVYDDDQEFGWQKPEEAIEQKAALQLLQATYPDTNFTRLDISSTDDRQEFTIYKGQVESHVLTIKHTDKTHATYEVVCTKPQIPNNRFLISNIKDMQTALVTAVGQIKLQQEHTKVVSEAHKQQLQERTRQLEEEARIKREHEEQKILGKFQVIEETSESKTLKIWPPIAALTDYEDKFYDITIAKGEDRLFTITYTCTSVYTDYYAQTEKRGQKSHSTDLVTFTCKANSLNEVQELCRKAVMCYSAHNFQTRPGGYPSFLLKQYPEPQANTPRRTPNSTKWINSKSAEHGDVLETGTIKATAVLAGAIYWEQQQQNILDEQYVAKGGENIFFPETLRAKAEEQRRIEEAAKPKDFTTEFTEACVQPVPLKVTYTRNLTFGRYEGTITDYNGADVGFEYDESRRQLVLHCTPEIRKSANAFLPALKEAWASYVDQVPQQQAQARNTHVLRDELPAEKSHKSNTHQPAKTRFLGLTGKGWSNLAFGIPYLVRHAKRKQSTAEPHPFAAPTTSLQPTTTASPFGTTPEAWGRKMVKNPGFDEDDITQQVLTYFNLGPEQQAPFKKVTAETYVDDVPASGSIEEWSDHYDEGELYIEFTYSGGVVEIMGIKGKEGDTFEQAFFNAWQAYEQQKTVDRQPAPEEKDLEPEQETQEFNSYKGREDELLVALNQAVPFSTSPQAQVRTIHIRDEENGTYIYEIFTKDKMSGGPKYTIQLKQPEAGHCQLHDLSTNTTCGAFSTTDAATALVCAITQIEWQQQLAQQQQRKPSPTTTSPTAEEQIQKVINTQCPAANVIAVEQSGGTGQKKYSLRVASLATKEHIATIEINTIRSEGRYKITCTLSYDAETIESIPLIQANVAGANSVEAVTAFLQSVHTQSLYTSLILNNQPALQKIQTKQITKGLAERHAITLTESDGTWSLYGPDNQVITTGTIAKQEFGFAEAFTITCKSSDPQTIEAIDLENALVVYANKLIQPQQQELPAQTSVAQTLYFTQNPELGNLEGTYTDNTFTVTSEKIGQITGTHESRFDDFKVQIGDNTYTYENGEHDIFYVEDAIMYAVKEYVREALNKQQPATVAQHETATSHQGSKAIKLVPVAEIKVDSIFNTNTITDTEDKGQTVHIGLISEKEGGKHFQKKPTDLQSSDGAEVKLATVQQGDNYLVERTYSYKKSGLIGSDTFNVTHHALQVNPPGQRTPLEAELKSAIQLIELIMAYRKQGRNIHYHTPKARINEMQTLLETVQLAEQLEGKSGTYKLPPNLTNPEITATLLQKKYRAQGVTIQPEAAEQYHFVS